MSTKKKRWRSDWHQIRAKPSAQSERLNPIASTFSPSWGENKVVSDRCARRWDRGRGGRGCGGGVGAAAKWINVDCQKENKKRATHPNQRRRRGKTASRNRASELRAQPTRRSGHEGSHERRSEGDGAAGKGGRRSTAAGGGEKREKRERGERGKQKKRETK